MQTITIAGVQMAPVFKDSDANLSALERHAAEAAAAGARLVIFPEAAVSGYCYDSLEEAREHAEPLPGPSVERLMSVCRERDVHVIYGTIERQGDRIHNAAVLVGPAGLVGVYRKTHLPHLGVDRFTTAGAEPPRVYDIGALRVGMLICYDGSFPEAPRVLMLAGADLIALPTNWPTGAMLTAEYLTNARALENHIYFAAVNRIGAERGFSFIGKSRICHPLGQTLARADTAEPALLLAEIDPAIARDKHIVRVPGLHEIHRINDRRPDLYGPLVAPLMSAFSIQ